MKKLFLSLALLMGLTTLNAQEWFTDVCDTVGEHKVQLELCKSHGPYVIYTGGNRQFTFCHNLKMAAGISIGGPIASQTATASSWSQAQCHRLSPWHPSLSSPCLTSGHRRRPDTPGLPLP